MFKKGIGEIFFDTINQAQV